MLTQAASEMRTFLERCANGQSMDGMFQVMQRLKEDAQEDEELRNWWSRVDSFAKKVSTTRLLPCTPLPSNFLSIDSSRARLHPCSDV